MSNAPQSPEDRAPPMARPVDPPRCLDCYYVLAGLRERRCPECERAFDPADLNTFTYKPPLIAWRLWLPGWLLAVALGLLATLTLAAFGSVGFALTAAVPMMVGAIVGYRCRVGPLLKFGLGLSAAVAVICALMFMHIAGLLCGIIALVLYSGTVGVGAVAGAALREHLKESTFSQRAHLPLILFGLVVAGGAAEHTIGWRPTSETVVTTADIDAPPSEVWRRLAFYEDVPGPRPWLLRIAGPVPLRTVVSADGATRTCFFEHGHISKRITEFAPERRLAFDVIEQHVGEEHAVRLRSGSFSFEPLAGGRTRVRLETRYEALLRPRVLWRPFERLVCGQVHEHVLTGLRRADEARVALVGPPDGE